MHLLFPGFWWIPKPRLVRIIIPHFSQRKYVKSTSWKFPVFLQFLAWWVRPGLVPVNIILILQIFFSFILISPCPIHPHFWQKCGSGQVFLLGIPETSSSGGPPRAEAPSCRVLCNSSVCVSSRCRCSDGRSVSGSPSSSLTSWDSSGSGVARFPPVPGTCVPMGTWEPSINDGVSVSKYLLRIIHFIKRFSLMQITNSQALQEGCTLWFLPLKWWHLMAKALP